MTPRQRRGQSIVLFHIVLVLLISVTVITEYVARRGTDRVLPQVTRLTLTALLCLWVYRGSVAARVITVVLLGFAGLYAGFLIVTIGGNFSAGKLVLYTMAGVYLSFAWILLMSDSVARFFEYQRG